MQFQVTIENTGETFGCGAEVNVLAAMERARCKGIQVGCRNGGCGACKVRITAGRYSTRKMNRAAVSAEEELEGCALACKTYPQSDIRVHALGKVIQAARPRAGASFSFQFTMPMPVAQPDKEA